MYRVSRSSLPIVGRRPLSTTVPSDPIPRSPLLPLPIPDDELATIQRRLNYTFANRTLLEDALTHISYPGREKRSYKSLKELGETTLRYTPPYYSSPNVLRYNLSPHKVARTALRLNLYSFLRRFSPQLDVEVQKFSDVHEGKVLYDCIPLKVPKVLPDLVYALFGAIVIDCKFNGEMAWQKMRLHLEPIYSWEDINALPMDFRLMELVKSRRMTFRIPCKREGSLQRARVYVEHVLHGSAASEDLSEATNLAAFDALNKIPTYMLHGTMLNTHPTKVRSF